MLRGKAIRIQTATIGANYAVSLSAKKDQVRPSGARVGRGDPRAPQSRLQLRKRAETQWKRVRLYSSKAERRPLRRGCSSERLFVRKKRNHQAKSTTLLPLLHSRRAALSLPHKKRGGE